MQQRLRELGEPRAAHHRKEHSALRQARTSVARRVGQLRQACEPSAQHLGTRHGNRHRVGCSASDFGAPKDVLPRLHAGTSIRVGNGREAADQRLAPCIAVDCRPFAEGTAQRPRHLGGHRRRAQRQQLERALRILRLPAHLEHQRQELQHRAVGARARRAERGQAMASQRGIENRIRADDHHLPESVVAQLHQPRGHLFGRLKRT